MMVEDYSARASEAFEGELDKIVRSGDYQKFVRALAAANDATPENRNCPDQYVGKIDEIVGRGCFPTRVSSRERTEDACIILILESPHTHEFGEFPGPAKGHTGANIARFIASVNGLEGKTAFGLVLMNAVQYQCSLGLPTALYRDRVFRSVWKKGGRDCFRQRLRKMHQSGDLVVNSCTRGKPKCGELALRDLVREELEGAFPDIDVMQRAHPACWHFSSRRR